MGTVISNLKARFGVDTSDFRRGLKDGEKALTDFKDVGKDSVGEFASLFGINMAGVNNALNTVGKSLNFIGQSFKAAAAGGDIFAISMKFLRTALISTGIGALIVALGSLIAYFKETEIGAKQLASGMTQVKAVWEVVKDRLGSFGGGLIDLIRGNSVLGLMKIKDAFTGIGEEARNAAYRGKEVAQMMYDLTYQERNFRIEKSQQQIEIDKLRLMSRDLDLSAQERLGALEKAAAIEKRVNKEALDIASDKILVAQKNLENDQDDIDLKEALAQAYIEYNSLISESVMFEYSLTRQKNALIKEIRNQLAEQKKLNDATKISDSGASFAPKIDTTSLVGSATGYLGKGVTEMKEFSLAAVEMGNVVNDSLRNMASGFGEWFGAFTSGVATLRDGRQMVGNALGDMLITLGRVAIGTGIGIEAIKKAFATLGGVGAIVAGTALVAFGSSIKGSIAAINNSRSASMEGTSMSGSAGSVTYAPATTLASANNARLIMEGTVRLQLSGADLLALLDNENTRVRIVT